MNIASIGGTDTDQATDPNLVIQAQQKVANAPATGGATAPTSTAAPPAIPGLSGLMAGASSAAGAAAKPLAGVAGTAAGLFGGGSGGIPSFMKNIVQPPTSAAGAVTGTASPSAPAGGGGIISKISSQLSGAATPSTPPAGGSSTFNLPAGTSALNVGATPGATPAPTPPNLSSAGSPMSLAAPGATASPTTSPAAGTRAAPTGPANDVSTPSTPLPGSAGTGLSTSATPTGNPYIDRLNGTQGMVNSAANNLAGVDRTKLAEQMFQTFSNATAPQYTAALRQATQRGAAGGQVGSGQLRTTYGDLANQRNLQLQTEEQGLQENATQGSIQDAFNKLSALSGLEGQQFGESNTLSQEAQNAAAQQYQQEMEGQAQNFNEGAELQQLGQSGNPAEYYTQMASQLGVDPTTLMLLGQGLGTQSAYGGARSPAANPGLKIPSLPTGPGNINIQTNQPAYGGTAVG